MEELKNSINKQQNCIPIQLDYNKLLEKQDFFSKTFLKPSQIILHKQQGIRIIHRNKIQPNKYKQQKIKSINEHTIILNKQLNSQIDCNLLSLFKRSTSRIKLAICISIFNEPKYMLKNTIRGVQNSYIPFLQKAGISSHQIVLVIIFDGIKYINNQIKDSTANTVSFFNQIDCNNGFNNNFETKSIDQYFQDLQYQTEKQFSHFQNKTKINIFSQQQFKDLQQKLFKNQYNEYLRICSLQQQIRQIKKYQRIEPYNLSHFMYQKYLELCRQYCRNKDEYIKQEIELEEYFSIRNNIRQKIIMKTIIQIQNMCDQYIASRSKTVLLYPSRMKIQNSNEKENTEINNYMFLAVKHQNQGKLSSHMLFFEGFCKLFDPQFCILMDVGVKPHKEAIYRMWAHMQSKPKCGGVCGYMSLKLQSSTNDLGYRNDGYNPSQLCSITKWMDYLFTIQRAQQFQYHFAHMFDKPFESAFGFIHVLPGAFSGYRWKALKSMIYQKNNQNIENINENKEQQIEEIKNYNDKNTNQIQQEQQQTLMKRYLKTILSNNKQLSLQDSNMYLAQDRIMCLGIYTLGYDLDYLPNVESFVDPVTSLTRMMGQRRRWINGSWFAFNYVRQHSFETDRKSFYIQLLYYSLVQKIAWFGPTLFYLIMHLTLITTMKQYIIPLFIQFFKIKKQYKLHQYNILGIINIYNIIKSIPNIINFVFILLIIINMLYSLSLNHNNAQYKRIYYFSSTILGFYGLTIAFLLIYNTYLIITSQISGQSNSQNFIIPLIYLRMLIMFIIIAHILPILWTFSIRKYWGMLVSVLSYLYYVPTYINLLQLFSFCRIDDLSWGTKGLDSNLNDQVKNDWTRSKYIFVLQYIASNVILAYVLVKLSSFDFIKNLIILLITFLTTSLLAIRVLFSAFYLLKFYLFLQPQQTFSKDYINHNKSKSAQILTTLQVIEQNIKNIEKQNTKRIKQQEYRQLIPITEEIVLEQLRDLNRQLSRKVANHMIGNNMFPIRQILHKKRMKKKKLMNNPIVLESICEVSKDSSKNKQSSQKIMQKKQKRIKSTEQIKARFQAYKMKNKMIKIN